MKVIKNCLSQNFIDAFHAFDFFNRCLSYFFTCSKNVKQKVSFFRSNASNLVKFRMCLLFLANLSVKGDCKTMGFISYSLQQAKFNRAFFSILQVCFVQEQKLLLVFLQAKSNQYQNCIVLKFRKLKKADLCHRQSQ